MALLALEAGVDVPHVREVRVVGDLVDADPRDGLAVLGVGVRVDLGDLGLLDRVRAPHDLVAPPAAGHGGNPGVHGALRRVVAELAVHVVLPLAAARVAVVGERDGLDGLSLPLGARLSRSTLDERETTQREDAGEPADQPVLFHKRRAPERSRAPGSGGRGRGRFALPANDCDNRNKPPQTA